MSPKSSEKEYIQWLRRTVDGRSPTLDIFFATLWDIPFTSTILRDKNRAEDGVALRHRYASETARAYPNTTYCTMLEFLVALAIRMNEQTYDWEHPDETATWFWVLIANMEIEIFTNTELEILGTGEIENAIFRVLNREFAPDGSQGGLFPLQNSVTNQQNVEIWVQLQNYIMELP